MVLNEIRVMEGEILGVIASSIRIGERAHSSIKSVI